MDSLFWRILKKNTKDCDFKANLEILISQNYSIEKLDEFKQSIIEIDALRKAALFKKPKSSDPNNPEHLSLLTNYYMQLVDLDAIYVACKGVKFTHGFTWYHSYEKTNIAGKYVKFVSKELSFEMANILFNLLSEIANHAVNFDMSINDQFNQIQKDLCLAASGFQYLATYSNSHNLSQLLDDLSPFYINLCSLLCIGQGYEMLFIKSFHLNKPAYIIAGIASQCNAIYFQCNSSIKSLKLNHTYIKDLNRYVEFKLLIYKGFTHYYQSIAEVKNSNMGEHYSRMNAAKEVFSKLDNNSGFKIKFYKDFIDTNIKSYMDSVIEESVNFNPIGIPSIKSLNAVTPVKILELKKFSIQSLSAYLTHTDKYSNLFDGLDSITVINLLHFFDLAKRNYINSIENEIHKYKKSMEKDFLSMDVPYRFEKVTEGFPPSITKCLEEFRKYGGLSTLQNNIEKVTDIQNFNVDMIESMRNDIRQVSEINRLLLNIYHHIQTQIDSTNAIHQHNSSVCYYFNKLEQTHNTDERLMTNFQKALKGFEFLSKSESEMVMGINMESDLELVKTDDTSNLAALNELYDHVLNLHEERLNLHDEMTKKNPFKDEIKFIVREFPQELHSAKIEDAVLALMEEPSLKLKDTYSKQDELINVMKEIVSQHAKLDRVTERKIELFKHITKYYNDFKEIAAHLDSSLKWHENFRNSVLNVQEDNTSFIKAYQYQVSEIIGPDVNKYFCMDEDTLISLSSKPPNNPHILGDKPVADPNLSENITNYNGLPVVGNSNAIHPGMASGSSHKQMRPPYNYNSGNFNGNHMMPVNSSDPAFYHNGNFPNLPPGNSGTFPNSNHPYIQSNDPNLRMHPNYPNSTINNNYPPPSNSIPANYNLSSNQKHNDLSQSHVIPNYNQFNNSKSGEIPRSTSNYNPLIHSKNGEPQPSVYSQSNISKPNDLAPHTSAVHPSSISSKHNEIPQNITNGYNSGSLKNRDLNQSNNRVRSTVDLLHSPEEYRNRPSAPPLAANGYNHVQNYPNYSMNLAVPNNDKSYSQSSKVHVNYDGPTGTEQTQVPPQPGSAYPGSQKQSFGQDLNKQPPNSISNNYSHPYPSSMNYVPSYNSGSFPSNFYPSNGNPRNHPYPISSNGPNNYPNNGHAIYPNGYPPNLAYHNNYQPLPSANHSSNHYLPYPNQNVGSSQQPYNYQPVNQSGGPSEQYPPNIPPYSNRYNDKYAPH